jgi:hypothetical protein
VRTDLTIWTDFRGLSFEDFTRIYMEEVYPEKENLSIEQKR